MKPLPKPSEWRQSNPGYETKPPQLKRIRLDPCDPNSRVVEVFELDAGLLFDMATHHESAKKK